MFFSASTGGFYTAEVHGSNMPNDALAITTGDYEALLQAQALGAEIKAGANGAPVAVFPPPPDPAAQLASLRARTSITRVQFCKALKTLGVMTAAEAIAAAKGEWPPAFAAALSIMPGIDPTDAQIEWAGTATIHRLYPLFVELLNWHGAAAGLTPAQAEALGDQIFGITAPTP